MLVAYFKDGGLYQDENFELMRELVAVVRSVVCPWLLAADFNVAPQVLFESALLAGCRAVYRESHLLRVATN